ncbi:MAG: hypothetical protein CMI54_05630 [Parcubacteria group bacterium]|jgi:hypothetical protein|nr:hypothetical protein [Parcubacteria group bacterium]|tara:strand:+ start:5942 stop:6700 length:759 start_codon:yes stop_codon:yes gene_type:complete
MTEKNTAMNFNANDVEPAKAFEPLQTGWYNVTITGSELKPTSKGDGEVLHLELTVLDGECANRKAFARLNKKNSNPVAQRIADEQLSAICHATQVMQVTNSQQLHNIPLQAKIQYVGERTEIINEATGETKTYEASNDVKAYKAVEGGAAVAAPTPGAPVTPPVAPPVSAPAAPAVPPPVAPPAAPPVPAAPTPPPAPEPVFPPEGWLPHPQSAGYFYKGQECVTEAELRSRFAAPTPPAAGGTKEEAPWEA